MEHESLYEDNDIDDLYQDENDEEDDDEDEDVGVGVVEEPDVVEVVAEEDPTGGSAVTASASVSAMDSATVTEPQQQQQQQQQQQRGPAVTRDPPKAPTPTASASSSAVPPPVTPKSPPKPPPPPPPSSSSSSTPKRPAIQNDLEKANDEIASLLLTNRITIHESSKLQSILRENAALKEKVNKLKTLLARSAKASKDTKHDLEQHKRLLDVAQKEVERLHDRVEALASRPTHMDLLADFETNFDKAMMNLHTSHPDDYNHNHHNSNSNNNNNHKRQGQTVGQPTEQQNDEENLTNMLMAELNQSKTRIENLEAVNAALKKRAAQFESQNASLLHDRESANLKMSNLQLELKMAMMETDNAKRHLASKTASLAEMQMEIDLVTRSAMDANARAAEGIEVAESARVDKALVDELKSKVAALQEWAVASAAAKEIIVEENKMLERKLEDYERELFESRSQDHNAGTGTGSGTGHGTGTGSGPSSPSSVGKTVERKLWTIHSSMVVGAGSFESKLIELGENKVMDFETVILRWKFDITPNDQDIHFSILRGRVDTKKNRKGADAVTRDRIVVGGGGGEVQGAFAVQNACTLVFSNEHSWVRPRAIKYTVEAFAIM